MLTPPRSSSPQVSTHPSCGFATRAAGIGFVISSLAPNIVDYAMVASRNLEGHLGPAAADGIGILLPFALAWRFYFGASFSRLVNAASPALNGSVQFLIPCLARLNPRPPPCRRGHTPLPQRAAARALARQ